MTEGAITMGLTPVGFDRLPGWAAENPAQALPAFLAGCAAIGRSSDPALGGAGEAAARGGTAPQWRDGLRGRRAPCRRAMTAARAFFEAYFQP